VILAAMPTHESSEGPYAKQAGVKREQHRVAAQGPRIGRGVAGTLFAALAWCGASVA
jgi:hypothetical protein